MHVHYCKCLETTGRGRDILTPMGRPIRDSSAGSAPSPAGTGSPLSPSRWGHGSDSTQAAQAGTAARAPRMADWGRGALHPAPAVPAPLRRNRKGGPGWGRPRQGVPLRWEAQPLLLWPPPPGGSAREPGAFVRGRVTRTTPAWRQTGGDAACFPTLAFASNVPFKKQRDLEKVNY